MNLIGEAPSFKRRVVCQFLGPLVMARSVPPHPGPLPWGEGEPPAATGRDVAINAPARAAPSP